jgi:hypothetical protein
MINTIFHFALLITVNFINTQAFFRSSGTCFQNTSSIRNVPFMDSVYALTIHYSQHSEFDTVLSLTSSTFKQHCNCGIKTVLK